MVTSSTVVLLLGLWLVALLPGLVRDRRRSPVTTVDHFAEAMRRLSGDEPRRPIVVPGAAGRRVVHPPGLAARRLRARRRRVLARLLLLALSAVVLAAVVGGGPAWSLAVLTLLAVVAYVVVLRVLAVRVAAARAVVRLHPAATRRDPAARPGRRPASVLLTAEQP